MGFTARTWPEGLTPSPENATLRLDIGVSVVPQIEVVMLDEQADYYVRAILIYSVSEGFYIPRQVTVGMSSLITDDDMSAVLQGERVESEPPVSSASLRQVKVAELVKYGAASGIFVSFKGHDRLEPVVSSWGDTEEGEFIATGFYDWMTTRSTREEILSHVGTVYMVSVMAGEPPAQTIERVFGMPKRTAANWISRAKAEGYIGVPELVTDNG